MSEVWIVLAVQGKQATGSRLVARPHAEPRTTMLLAASAKTPLTKGARHRKRPLSYGPASPGANGLASSQPSAAASGQTPKAQPAGGSDAAAARHVPSASGAKPAMLQIDCQAIQMLCDPLLMLSARSHPRRSTRSMPVELTLEPGSCQLFRPCFESLRASRLYSWLRHVTCPLMPGPRLLHCS